MREEEKEEKKGCLGKSPAEGYISLYAIQFVTKAHVLQPFFAQLPSSIPFTRYKGYYTVARRYEFYVRVARTISHE